MKIKTFVLTSLAGFVVYYILGVLFYGLLFTDIYPKEQNLMSTVFIASGSLFTALAYTYILSKAQVNTFTSGLVLGFVLGLLYAISMNFFMYSSRDTCLTSVLIDVGIGGVSTSLMCGVIGVCFGKSKRL